jgi:phosphocarrier protein HPr
VGGEIEEPDMSESFHLTPAELKAITEHRQRMEAERRREVTVEEAIADFLANYKRHWMEEKQRRDNQAQLQEIERYKWFRSEEEHRDIGLDRAAAEWSAKYASIWREERESLEKNGFQRMMVTVAIPQGLHVRPSSQIAQMIGRYQCDVYVSKQGMPYYNFMMHGKPHMNVKSILGFLSLGIIFRDELEFVASGPEAATALVAICELVGRPFDYEEPCDYSI